MATVYDLMLLLSTEATDEQRAKILGDVQAAVAAGRGEVVASTPWGVRAMTYQIAHRADAEYHLVQFTGPRELLESLDHNLKITDGVVRFRIIKAPAGSRADGAAPATATAASAGGEEPAEPASAGQ